MEQESFSIRFLKSGYETGSTSSPLVLIKTSTEMPEIDTKIRLDNLKIEGISFFKNLMQQIEGGTILKDKEGVWFQKYQDDFEKWAFSINSTLREMREEVVLNENLVPFNSKIEENIVKECERCREFFEMHVNKYMELNALLKAKFIIDKIEELDFFKPAPLETHHGETVPNSPFQDPSENLENQIISNMIGIQIVMEVCLGFQKDLQIINSFQSKEIKIPKILQDLIKDCEVKLDALSKTLEEEIIGNLNKQAETEKMIIFLTELELVVNTPEFQYQAWVEECAIKKAQVMREQKRHNDYMMFLLRKMRLGLITSQQVRIYDNLEKNIMILDSQAETLIVAGILRTDDLGIEFDYQDNEFIKQNQELFKIILDRAHQSGDKLLKSLSLYQKQALEEQLDFFCSNARFIRIFCTGHGFDIEPIKITKDSLKKIPSTFTIASLFPAGNTFNKFCHAVNIQMEEDRQQIEKIMMSDLPILDKKINKLIGKLNKYELDLLNFKNILGEAENQKNILSSQIDKIKIKLTKKAPKEILSQVSGEDDLMDLFFINDSIVDNIKFKIDDIDFQIKMNEEMLEGEFKPDELEAAKMRKEIGQLIVEKESLTAQLKECSEESYRTKALLEKIQNDYFTCQNTISEFSEREIETSTLKESKSKKLQHLVKEKAQLEQKLAQYRRDHFHLYSIIQRIYVRNAVLGTNPLLDEQEEVEYDLPLRAKSKSQIVIEDLCMAIVGCASDSFAEIYDKDEEKMKSKLRDLSQHIQKAVEFFSKQLYDCFMAAKYEKNYIDSQIFQLQRLSETISEPIKIVCAGMEIRCSVRI